MTTQKAIANFLSEKVLALAGASRGGQKFGNTLLKNLQAKGYEILPVHPTASTIGGLPCYRSLAELPRRVGGLVLVVPPAQTERLVREATAAGIHKIWMQQGSESAEAVRFCQENGITVIDGQCLLMFAEPAEWMHRLHRWINGVCDKLPPLGD